MFSRGLPDGPGVLSLVSAKAKLQLPDQHSRPQRVVEMVEGQEVRKPLHASFVQSSDAWFSSTNALM